MFDEKNPGPYNLLYNSLVAGSDFEIVLTMLPIRRASQIFSARGADCMFLGSPDPIIYSGFGMEQNEIIHSDTIMTVSMKIYGPVGSEPINDPSKLFDINFAVDVSVGDISQLKELIPYDREGILFARTLADGFRLLDQGRVEALIAIDIDVKTLQAQDARYELYSVSDSFVLRQTEDVFVCRKFPRTEQFIEYINQRNSELQKAGLLNDIFPR